MRHHFAWGKGSDRARWGDTQGHHTDAHVRTWRRHDRRREIRHLRFVARHRLRMVRLLPLCRSGAVLRRAVLSPRQRYGGAAVCVCDLRRGIPDPAVRRAGVRPHRRPGRTEIHLPGHHHGDGHLDLPGRSAADLHHDRLACPDPPGDAAAVPGSCPWRGIRRRRDLRRRAFAARRARLLDELDPDHGDARSLARPHRHRPVPRIHAAQGFFRLGLAHSVHRIGHPADLLRSISGSSSTRRRYSSG